MNSVHAQKLRKVYIGRETELEKGSHQVIIVLGEHAQMMVIELLVKRQLEVC
jgi:hypothetical protein